MENSVAFKFDKMKIDAEFSKKKEHWFLEKASNNYYIWQIKKRFRIFQKRWSSKFDKLKDE